jgi:hypothetical protein
MQQQIKNVQLKLIALVEDGVYYSRLPSFFFFLALSIILYSEEHNVSEAGSVPILR